MNTFIKKSLLFIIILSAILTILEVVARIVYLNTEDYCFKIESFEEIMDNVEILFLGNSHQEQAINPQYLSVTGYNLAYRSQDLYYDLKILQKYIDNLPSLKTVCIALDNYSFGYDEAEVDDKWLQSYYKCANIYPKKNKLKFLFNLSDLWKHRDTFIFDLFKKKRKRNERIFHSWRTPDTAPSNNFILKSGFRYVGSSIDSLELESFGVWVSDLRLNKYYNESYVGENINYLEEIITIVQNRKMKMVFLILPYHFTYIKNMNKKLEHDFRKKLEKILTKWSNIEFHDFSISFDYPDSLFECSDHLNFRGAEKFTSSLDSIIIQTPDTSSVFSGVPQ